MRKGENFGRISEGHWTLAWRVEGRENKDEEGNQTQVSMGLLRDDEAKACCEESPGHVRKGEEEQCTPAVGINGPNGRPGEDEVDQSKTEGGEESLETTRASFHENGGGVKGYDVDTTHLLSQHDREGSQGRAANPGDGEKFDESSDIVALADDIGLLENLSMDIVQITSSL